MELRAAALRALLLTDPGAKAAAAQVLPSAHGALLDTQSPLPAPPALPGRPPRPRLVPASALPRRSPFTIEGRAALLHAVAHIEFNAINLALDAVQRFPGLPPGFHGDWLRVAAEEAYHFTLLRDHLRAQGRDYGDFPAHDGLWEMALKTAHDPLARMALVPRLMEARGLDVTPDIQRKLKGFGDPAGAAILDIILRDEIGHVAAGDRWFRHLCAQRGLQPEAAFRELLCLPGVPRPRRPFNETARLAAGFSEQEMAALMADNVADKTAENADKNVVISPCPRGVGRA